MNEGYTDNLISYRYVVGKGRSNITNSLSKFFDATPEGENQFLKVKLQCASETLSIKVSYFYY